MTEEKSKFLRSLETSVFFLIKKEASGNNELLVKMYEKFLEDITNPEVIRDIVDTLFELDGLFDFDELDDKCEKSR